MKRIPASERRREKLKAVIEGTSEGGGTSELVRLAARLIIEEALEGEARDALGREYYARGTAARGWLPQWLPQRAAGQRRGADRVQRAANCRPRRAVPLGNSRDHARPNRRAGGAGGGDVAPSI